MKLYFVANIVVVIPDGVTDDLRGRGMRRETNES